jgi:hypothetical protein
MGGPVKGGEKGIGSERRKRKTQHLGLHVVLLLLEELRCLKAPRHICAG